MVGGSPILPGTLSSRRLAGTSPLVTTATLISVGVPLLVVSPRSLSLCLSLSLSLPLSLILFLLLPPPSLILLLLLLLLLILSTSTSFTSTSSTSASSATSTSLYSRTAKPKLSESLRLEAPLNSTATDHDRTPAHCPWIRLEPKVIRVARMAHIEGLCGCRSLRLR